MKCVINLVLYVMCPVRTRRRRRSRRRRPPLSPEAARSKHRRRRLERRWLHTRDPADRAEFRQCCRQTSGLISESRRKRVVDELGQCDNARQRWTVIRLLLHTDSRNSNNCNSPEM